MFCDPGGFIVHSFISAHNEGVPLLLVEDEARVAAFIAKGLREQSYVVDIAADGEQAMYLAAVNRYDAVIVDVLLPEKDGYSVCRELRQSGFTASILILSARDSIDDRMMGLNSGADDYLVKPFDFSELLVRLRALSRRSKVPRAGMLCAADLVINTASRTVTRAGRSVNLTEKEYSLLELLMLHQGRVVRVEEIALYVWDGYVDPFPDVVDVYVKRLRVKLDTGDGHELIHTRRGQGYILTPDPRQ
jgi:two-component system copper resistance phosphate regulon response regulator CusR